MKKAIALVVICLVACTTWALADQIPLRPPLRSEGITVPAPVGRDGSCALGLPVPDAANANAFAWGDLEVDKVYLDPAIDQQSGACTAPLYPFHISSVDIYFTVWGDLSDIGQTITIGVDIECPADLASTNVPTDCKGPGPVICSATGSYTVSQADYDPPNNGVFIINVPLDCCVDRPFFVGNHFISYTGAAGLAPAPLFQWTALIPNQGCRSWAYWDLGNGFCWFSMTTDVGCGAGCFTGPWYIYANGEAGVPCNPVSNCVAAPRTYPGDDAGNPIQVTSAPWIQVVDLCSFASDYDQQFDDGIPAGSFTGRGGDAVLSIEFDAALPEVCFSILLEPLCTPPYQQFRIRSWLNDSYGTVYDGNPRFPLVGGTQSYDFTPSGLGCLPPDRYLLFLDTRNCCCPVRVTFSGDTPLPVELTSFDAVAGNGQVTLTWITASERDMDFFQITRDGEALAEVTATNSPTGHTYTYVDRGVVNGTTYEYQLSAQDINGAVTVWPTIQSATPEAGLVTEYSLAQNYPNPFNPSTSISYAVKDAGLVTLTVYSIDGREVATLVNGVQPTGAYTVNFDAQDLASGVYLYKLEANGFSATHKMVLMK